MMTAMPGFIPPRKTPHVADLFTDIRRVVGVTLAKRLTPRFAEAAVGYQVSERETIAQTERRRTGAKKLIAALDAADRRFGRLLEGLHEVTALIPGAATRESPPGTARSGPIGQLAERSAIGKNRDAGGDAVQIVRDVHAWRDTVRAWRDTARLDMRGKPGRKVGDRRVLAEWVALQLAREGVPLKKNADGTFALVLLTVYKSCGITQPQDLYGDVCRAIDATVRDRSHLS
jgi:hypothetical protein